MLEEDLSSFGFRRAPKAVQCGTHKSAWWSHRYNAYNIASQVVVIEKRVHTYSCLSRNDFDVSNSYGVSASAMKVP